MSLSYPISPLWRRDLREPQAFLIVVNSGGFLFFFLISSDPTPTLTRLGFSPFSLQLAR